MFKSVCEHLLTRALYESKPGSWEKSFLQWPLMDWGNIVLSFYLSNSYRFGIPLTDVDSMRAWDCLCSHPLFHTVRFSCWHVAGLVFPSVLGVLCCKRAFCAWMLWCPQSGREGPGKFDCWSGCWRKQICLAPNTQRTSGASAQTWIWMCEVVMKWIKK